jgi:hypothetical protein
VTGKAGREATEQGAKSVTRQLGRVAVKNADDVAVAIGKCGSRASRWIDDAGEHAGLAARLLAKHGDSAAKLVTNPKSLRMAAKYGDEGVEAILKFGDGVAVPLLDQFGAPAARALKGLSSQSARRVAMLADGPLAHQSDEVLEIISKYGDEAVDFIYRNKGTLAGSAAMVAFLASPETFIQGGVALTDVVADAAIRPVVATVMGMIPWVLILSVVGLAAVLILAWATGKSTLVLSLIRTLIFKRTAPAKVNGHPVPPVVRPAATDGEQPTLN